MRAVIAVIGKDMVGILANVSQKCAEYGINVTEVTQSVLQDVFAMIMMVDLRKSTVPVATLSDELSKIGDKMGLKIYVMHEDIFNSMHKI